MTRAQKAKPSKNLMLNNTMIYRHQLTEEGNMNKANENSFCSFKLE